MIYKTFLLNIIILFILSGCSNNNQPIKSDEDKASIEHLISDNDSNIIKVYINESGMITANGSSISITALDSSFSKLKMNNGTVHYSRANVQEEPTEKAMQVIELIVKYGLPVQLYTDKTFREVIKVN